MIYLLGGVFLFLLVLRALRAFAEASPASLALMIRRGSGGAALLAGYCGALRHGDRSWRAWRLVAWNAQRIAFSNVQIVQPPGKAESFLGKVGDDRGSGGSCQRSQGCSDAASPIGRFC
jgi:hypothetical protein